jgi:hypothetical protein
MRALAAEAAGRYPEMAGQRVSRSRNWAPSAWAARAAAAGRDGLAVVVAEGMSCRRHLGTGPGCTGSDLTPEDLALLVYVEKAIEETPEPDVASDPADVPVIERLVAAGEGSEYRMTALLLDPGAESLIWRGELPEGVAPLRRPREASPCAEAQDPEPEPEAEP